MERVVSQVLARHMARPDPSCDGMVVSSLLSSDLNPSRSLPVPSPKEVLVPTWPHKKRLDPRNPWVDLRVQWVLGVDRCPSPNLKLPRRTYRSSPSIHW